ncbi:NAD(P)-dependent dehydrogenase (short-subunit alcohol dehydrogenase family) [Bacillus sp. V2I10]|nr:NAD(P)-dependent dehydrogenase (short-subunit alcohol dehydrogenase family) [Bacillus sp. V2I10]
MLKMDIDLNSLMNGEIDMKLKDKVAIVTGGASGIGEATVRLFAEEGAKVVIADISKRGKDILEELNTNGYDTLFVKTDVTKEEDIKQMINETVNQYGKLDIMYANAGVADDAPTPMKNGNELSILIYQGYSFLINIRLNSFLNKVQAVSLLTLVLFIVLFHYQIQQPIPLQKVA